MTGETVYKVPQHIRKLIGQAYIYSIAGDPWNRINYTGALLTLLRNAITMSMPHDNADRTLVDAMTIKHGNAIMDYEREEFWGHAVWLCEQIVGNVGHLAIEKYGEIPPAGFSILNVGTVQQKPVAKQEA